jgi:hypothetical protein
MYGQRRKGLCGALGEADVGERGLVGRLEDVGNRVGDVAEGELIHAEVPEGACRGGRVDALLGVLVAAVVAEPDIVAALDQLKRQAALSLRLAHPDLAVHHQAVVHVHDLFLQPALTAAVDPEPLLAGPPCQAMHAQQVAVVGLHNVLLTVVAVQLAQLGEVAGIGNGRPDTLLLLARLDRRRRRELVPYAAREAVAEVDDGRREGEGDDGDEGLEADEDDGEEQGDVFADVQAREEGDVDRHGGCGVCLCVAWARISIEA